MDTAVPDSAKYRQYNSCTYSSVERLSLYIRRTIKGKPVASPTMSSPSLLSQSMYRHLTVVNTFDCRPFHQDVRSTPS